MSNEAIICVRDLREGPTDAFIHDALVASNTSYAEPILRMWDTGDYSQAEIRQRIQEEISTEIQARENLGQQQALWEFELLRGPLSVFVELGYIPPLEIIDLRT